MKKDIGKLKEKAKSLLPFILMVIATHNFFVTWGIVTPIDWYKLIFSYLGVVFIVLALYFEHKFQGAKTEDTYIHFKSADEIEPDIESVTIEG